MEQGPAVRAPADAWGVVAQTPGVRLVYWMASREGGLSAARWKIDDCRVTTGDMAQGILVFRTSGSAVVTRRSASGSLRRRPAIGAATFVSADTRATWSVEGSSEALHVYIPRTTLCRYAEQELDAARPPAIEEFFAVVDPWLRGYLQMLTAEADASWAAGHAADTMLLEETEHALVRRLFRCHSDIDRRRAGALSAVPLQSGVMHRVQQYVDAHLASEIHLRDLAALGYMSAGHFLRRFRAACGTTPYQYVLEQRLQRARSMLVQGGEPLTLIARECGLGTASHLSARFHARFGMRPSSYRSAGARQRIFAGVVADYDPGSRRVRTVVRA
jgi:AraC family transcriptional regulator